LTEKFAPLFAPGLLARSLQNGPSIQIKIEITQTVACVPSKRYSKSFVSLTFAAFPSSVH